MKLKLIACIITACVAGTILNAQQTISGFEAPESVVKVYDKLFVSNIGGEQPNPTALDSNGFISELSLNGKIIQRKFSKTILNGPKGLAVIGNILYTADINRVVGFDINSGEQVFELNIPGSMMLNDLCTINANQIVVSESISGKIYLININNKSYSFIGHIPGANGVTYAPITKTLYACGMGEDTIMTGNLYEKNLDNTDTIFTELADSPSGIFDGLEMIDNNHLLVTDWKGSDTTKGRIVIYDLKDHTNKQYSVDAGPADIHYDKATQTFYLPQMPKNDLLIEKLSSLK